MKSAPTFARRIFARTQDGTPNTFLADLLQPATLAVTLVLIFSLLGPILTIGREQSAAASLSGGGNAIRQVTYLIAFGVCLWAVNAASDLRRMLVLPWTIMAVLLWFWLSLTWAIEPSVAIRRLFLTTLIVWMVFLAVEAAGYAKTLAMLRLVLALTLFINYAAIVVLPSAIHHVDELGDPGLVGDWRGIMPQKNVTGAACAFTILVFALDPTRLNTIFRLGMIVASAFYLFKTGSKTSTALMLLCLVLGGLYRLYDKKYRGLILPILTMIAAAFVLATHSLWNGWLQALQRPGAVTGRGQIWPVIINYVKDHWLLGSGYGSFWNIGPSSPIYVYARGWLLTITHAHNGYLNLVIQVGAFGLLLAVIAAFVAPLFTLLSNRKISGRDGALPTAILIFCIGHNMTETSLFERDELVQVFMLFAIALTTVLVRYPSAREQNLADLSAAETESRNTRGRRRMRTAPARRMTAGQSSTPIP